MNAKTPPYRCQKSKPYDRAFVVLGGCRVYLGRYGTPESRAEYDRRIAEWLAHGRRLPATPEVLTVKELVARFWKHVQEYYRRPDGTAAAEVDNYRLALRPVVAIYGTTGAADFGPRALKVCREWFIERDASRRYINKHVTRIRAMFRWAAAEELLPVAVFQTLQAVPGLKAGRCAARETDPVRPVADHLIDAIRPHVSRQVWAIVQLQLLTAARAGELVTMRARDIDVSGKVWTYAPREHKTAHHGHRRTIYLGPSAQAVVRPFMADRSVDAPLFSPRDAEAERRIRLHKARVTRLSCGNKPGSNRKAAPAWTPGDAYDVASYRRAIQRACDLAFPVPDGLDGAAAAQWRKDHAWHPHQLRHNAATHLRKEFGLETARIILGHRSAAITEVYAELDHEKAVEAAAKVG